MNVKLIAHKFVLFFFSHNFFLCSISVNVPAKKNLSRKAKAEEAKHYQSKFLEKLIFANLEQFLER